MFKISEPMYALAAVIVLTVTLLIATDSFAGSGSPEDYPELPIWYQAELPTEYTYPELAADIHDSASFSVTLRKREKLVDAANRLKDKSDGVGGRLLIPWSVDTIQCDDLYFKRAQMDSVTIEGVIGPTGQRPRFYCRKIKAGGHIPNKGIGGVWLVGGAKQSTMIKNLEVDGYGKFHQIGSYAPHVIYKNVHLHNATGDGVTTGNIYEDSEVTVDRLLVFAGVEISHAGQGNFKHCMYIHRSHKPDVNAKLVVMNSKIYSCNWSSGIKSIANENIIVDNSFWRYMDAVDSEGRHAYQPRRYSHMSVDIASASKSIVERNVFHDNRPLDAKAPSGAVIGVRNRRSIYGNDRPRGWRAGQVRLESDNSKHECARNPFIAECLKPDSDFWKPEWWSAKNGERDMPFIIRDNVFHITGPARLLDRTRVIQASGTYPNYTYTLGGWSCPMEVVDTWYERVIVKVSGNTYNGLDINAQTAKWRYEDKPSGWGHPTKCLTPPPEVDRRCTAANGCSFFEIGEGEVFNPPVNDSNGFVGVE